MCVYIYIYTYTLYINVCVYTHAHMGGQTEPVLEIQFKALYVPGKQCTSDLHPCPQSILYIMTFITL